MAGATKLPSLRREVSVPKASRANHPSRPVRGADSFDANHSPGAWRVDKLVPTKPQCDVRSTRCNGAKEDEIALFELVEANPVTHLKLCFHVPRQCDAVLREHVLNKPAA